MCEVIVYIILFLSTIAGMIWLSYPTKAMMDFLKDNRIAREECDIDPKISIKSIIPKNYLDPIQNNPKITKDDKRKIDKLYRKFFKTYLVFYILFIIHVLYWFYLIHGIIIDWGKWNDLIMPFRFAVSFMDFIISYCLYLTPIFEVMGKHKIAQVGPVMFSLVERTSENLSFCMLKGICLFAEFIISILLLYYYLKGLRALGIPQDFVYSLIELLVYQYLILKIISFILNKLINVLKLLKKFRRDNSMYRIFIRLKSTTFLSLILIYAIAIHYDPSTAAKPFYAALGVLFLFDTYIEQRFPMKSKPLNIQTIQSSETISNTNS